MYLDVALDETVSPPITDTVTVSGLGYTFTTSKVIPPVVKLLERMSVPLGGGSDSELQAALKELFATHPTVAETRMSLAGDLLKQEFFVPDAQARMVQVISSGRPLRLVVRSADTSLHYLPWEWLPGVTPIQLLLTAAGASVVRQLTTEGATTSSPLATPLRVMSIMPPAPKGRRFTADNTLKSLESLFADEEVVRYVPLQREAATLENITAEMKVFQPHIVHFEGFVTIAPNTPDVRALEVHFGGTEQILTTQFAQLLKDNNVQLLVIGRNSMAQMYVNLGARLAFLFVEAGLPAVIAPMRAIDDASATTFTTDFYRAFVQGNTLESALYIARRKLASKGGDWSVFALFADPARLDYFQLLRESA
jgi:hypothetical protein